MFIFIEDLKKKTIKNRSERSERQPLKYPLPFYYYRITRVDTCGVTRTSGTGMTGDYARGRFFYAFFVVMVFPFRRIHSWNRHGMLSTLTSRRRFPVPRDGT